MTKRWLLQLAQASLLLASLASAVHATERVTLPVRDGDNVSMMLAMSGVNQGVLMELISSREIAARLEAVREGNTLELELDAGKLVALWLYDADSRAFRARLRADGSWLPGDTQLSETALLASRVRQREARGLRARVELAEKARVVGLSQAVIAAEVEVHPKVQAARNTQLAAAQPPRRSRAKPATPPAPSRAVEAEPDAASKTVSEPKPAPAPRRETKPWPLQRPDTITAPIEVATAAPQATVSDTGIAEQREPPTRQSESALALAPTARVPAPTEVVPDATRTLAPESPTSEVPTKDTPISPAYDEPASNAVATTAPLRCPSIAGAWQASYTNFDCKAEISFTSASPGVYTMAQVGCGDIDGTVSQQGRRLSGEWEHSICDGVLTLTLDESCAAGTGTWQANAGKALCSVKQYPVTITRGLAGDAKPRKKLKLFSGPSKEAMASENEAAGDQ